MPLVGGSIAINANGGAEARAAVSAAREHHVCAGAVAWRSNTAQHVNVVVRRAAGTVHCHENLRCQSSWIYIPAGTHTPQIHLSDLFKGWRLIAKLRVTGADAPKSDINQILSADEQIAVGIHVSRSMYHSMGNVDRRLPVHAAVCGTTKFAGGARKVGRPELVMKPVTWPASLINCKPLLVASACPRKIGPRLAAVGGLPDVVTKVVSSKAEIMKRSQLVRIQNGIAAENTGF